MQHRTPPPKSVRDAERVAEAREIAEHVRVERNVKMENLMKSRDGRDIMAAILMKTGIFNDHWTGNSEMFKFAGMRSIGLWLRDWIVDANIDSYVTILKESKENVGTGNTKGR